MTTNIHLQSMAGHQRLAAELLRSAIVDLRKKDRKGFRHSDIGSIHQANLDWLNEVPCPPARRGESEQFPLSLVAELWGVETHWLRYRVACKAGLDVSGPSRIVSIPADAEARKRRIAEIVAAEKIEIGGSDEQSVEED